MPSRLHIGFTLGQVDRRRIGFTWLIALSLVVLGAVAGLWLSQPWTSVVLILLGIGLALWPRLSDRLARLSGRSLELPPLVLALVFSVSASSVVAGIANRSEPYDTYWPAFGLWCVALALPLVVAGGVRWPVRFNWADLLGWSSKLRIDLALLLLLVTFAAVVRFANLVSLPYPFATDEAGHALWGQAVRDGEMKNMFISWFQGQTTMYYFMLGGLEKIFGATVFGVRVYGAVFGVLCVAVLYVFLRQAFDRLIAVVGATYLAFYHFHVQFSRVDLSNIGPVLMGALVVLFTWRAVRYGATRDFMLAGLTAGLGLYVDVGARVLPLIILAVFFLAALQDRSFLRKNAVNLGVLLTVFVAAGLPIGVFWLRDRAAFMDRLSNVGIFQSGWFDQQTDAGRNPVGVIWDQTVHAFGGFGRYHDRSGFYLAPISLVDRYSLVPFLLGVLVALWRFWEARYAALLALFVGTVASGGVLTIGPPTSQRILAATVPVAVFVAIGLVALMRFVFSGRPQLAAPVAAVVLAALVAYNIHFYFFRYAAGDYFSSANDRVMYVASEYLNKLPEGTVVYWYGGHRLYPGPMNAFIAPKQLAVDVNPEDGRLSPEIDATGHPVAFVFLPHRFADMQAVLTACPGGVMTNLGDAAKDTNFAVYVLDPSASCAPIVASTSTGRGPPLDQGTMATASALLQ